MSPRGIGIGVAALMAALWALGALKPPHPLHWTALDLRWYFFPLYEAFYGALRAGAPMIWNPYQLCGIPLLGTLQAGFFYPFHVLYLLLPTGWALAVSTALHVGLAAGSAAAFARRAGLSPAAATLAGTVFATTGTMRHWQLWPYLLEACAWMPVGAIAVLDLTGDRRGRGALLLALSTGASFLAGGPQGTILAAYAWAGLLLVRLLLGAGMHTRWLPGLGAFGAALVTGGALAAVALLPAYDVAREGVRLTETLSPAYLYAMGRPTMLGFAQLWIASEPYVMLPAIALVPFALPAARGWPALWAMAVGGLAVLLAIGPATPAFRLYYVLPLLSWFREPTRLLLIAGLCLGILAGLGLDTLARLLRTRAASVLVTGVILAAVTAHGLWTPRPNPPLPYLRSDLPWDARLYDAELRLAQAIGPDRVWPVNASTAADSLPPKLPTVTRLRAIEDYEPLALRRQSEFFVYFLEGSTRYWQLTESFEGRMWKFLPPRGREPPAARRRLLDLTATRWIVMHSPTATGPYVAAFIRDAGLVPGPPLEPGLALFENPHSLPRAYVTYRARRAPPARELLREMARDGFDPLVESWIEADADLGTASDALPRGAAATIVRDDPQVVEVDATLAAPGLVVLSDTYASGWTATVDGSPAPVLATNHLFRGVRAPAGTHRVRFEYRPRSLVIGAALTLASALGLLVLAWRARGGW